MPESNDDNPRKPELTDAQIEQVVDVFLHLLIEECDERFGVMACLTGHLAGCNRSMASRVKRAFRQRRDQYKALAHRIEL